MKSLNHQMEMFNKDFNRLDKEQNMTDFYLNKVLPITNFTQMMTTFRSVVDEEEQLNKLQEVQDKFFKGLQPEATSDDLTESIIESQIEEENSMKVPS